MAKSKSKKIRRDARPPAEIPTEKISVTEKVLTATEILPAEKFPTVSVILTSYNHAKYISAAIDSALKQTFTDFELLIVDDGSVDNSREVIKSFDDPRIKLFLYEENRGPVIAIREAVNSARGKYIAVHHSDDLWTADKLQRQVEFMETHEKFAACFTWVDFIDEHGEVHELDDTDFYQKIFEQPNRTRAEWLNYFFSNTNCLCHPSALLRREAYEKFQLTDVHGFWQLPDYLMWIRLCFHADIYILPERLTKFRLRRERQENFSATTFDKLVRADLEFYFIAKEFVYNFTDNKFFLEVFPDAQKFVVDGQINRRFAFAQMCLEKDKAAWQLAGLEILKELLTASASAAELKTLYDYDEKSFLRDGGKFDVFNLEQKLGVLHAEIFFDAGDGFKLATRKFIDLNAANKFYARIEFNVDKPAKYLRFDPDNKFISVALKNVLINGASAQVLSANAFERHEDFYRFFTDDPQFVFAADLSGRVTCEIFGELEPDFMTITTSTLESFRQKVLEQNEQLADRERQIANREAIIADLERHKAELLNRVEYMQNLNRNLTAQNAELTSENQRLANLADTVLNSTSWKVTEPLRDLGQWARSSNKDKVLSAARLLYKAVPLSDETKTELKNKFYLKFAPLLKDTKRYEAWQNAYAWSALPTDERTARFYENPFAGELFSQPGKIAIQAHIFYIDLLDEMAHFCANMPYKFDALISVVDEKVAEKVATTFQKISNAENVIVRIVPNRGRDVAPFLVGFGDVVMDYDFVAHIHSKKSLYTGSEQQNWRNYLFQSLLGTQEQIRKIFKAFADNPKLGVIYPRPAENVPYAAFTWLSNRAAGSNLLSRAKIPPNKMDYFDFPAGTMFWARTQALQKFFRIGLTFEDFPPEHGQNDGTIAHAFERSIVLAAQSEDMDFYEFDLTSSAYSINRGNKNLWQYLDTRNMLDAELDWVLNQGELVTFDIFDTLIMRLVAKPAHVNEIIRLKVEDLLGREFDFPKLRLQAEADARHLKVSDVTLDDIYKSFATLSGLDDETCAKIRELEISTEVKLTVPREDVITWFNEILRRGRKIWLISDMYMTTPDLERLLKKCGVAGYEKLLISCETGLRKDTAAIWDKLVADGYAGKIVHLGDNETSDVQLPGDRNFGIYHLMNAINLFSQTTFGRSLLNRLGYSMSLYAGIFLGVTLAKKFQSPFRLQRALTDNTNNLLIKNFRELGYWLYGAPLLTFMLWLIQKSRADGVERIFFLARDGYFLQPLYQFVTKLLKIEPLPSDYFYASRRAVTVASIREISQAKALAKLKFEGTTKTFFKARFGLDLGDDTKISLPNEIDQNIPNLIDAHAEEILSHAADERANYEKYIADLGGSLDNVGVVDMGYSGTIQYHLQQLTEKNFTGYYFATCLTNRFGDDAEKFLRGCFTENDDYGLTKSAVYKFQLLFEAILTAPDAQLKNFDAQGNPVFGKPEPGQNYFAELCEVHEGIKDFCRDVLENFGDVILRVPIDKNFVEAWVRSFVCDKHVVASELRTIFSFEDEYCNTFHGNALDFYLDEIVPLEKS